MCTIDFREKHNGSAGEGLTCHLTTLVFIKSPIGLFFKPIVKG